MAPAEIKRCTVPIGLGHLKATCRRPSVLTVKIGDVEHHFCVAHQGCWRDASADHLEPVAPQPGGEAVQAPSLFSNIPESAVPLTAESIAESRRALRPGAFDAEAEVLALEQANANGKPPRNPIREREQAARRVESNPPAGKPTDWEF